MKSEAEMLKYRNFGKKSLNEIKDKLEELQLGLGLKFESGLIEVQPEPEQTEEAEDDKKSKKKK
jgi:DNA-directed RNA polymerase subunit alpha